MKSKKEMECVLAFMELQEMLIPIVFIKKKLFVRKGIRFIRKYMSETEGELIDLEKLQEKIDRTVFPQMLNGKLTKWQIDWVTGIMNYLYYWNL